MVNSKEESIKWDSVDNKISCVCTASMELCVSVFVVHYYLGFTCSFARQNLKIVLVYGLSDYLLFANK